MTQINFNKENSSLTIEVTSSNFTFSELMDSLGDNNIVQANEIEQNYIAFESYVYELDDTTIEKLKRDKEVELTCLGTVFELADDDFFEWYYGIKKEQYTNKTIELVSGLDSVSLAEKISNVPVDKKPYLALYINKMQSDAMNYLMGKTSDTKLSNKLKDYIDIVEKIGFKKIFEEDFKGDDNHNEKLFIYWHDELSILLRFDTYNEKDVNASSIYYNWIPKNIEDSHKYTSSGCFESLNMKPDFSGEMKIPFEKPKFNLTNFFEDIKKYNQKVIEFREENNLLPIWSGEHDGRESLKFKINNLRQNGIFLKKWYKAPFLWLLNYEEGDKNRDRDYAKINKKKISQFPEYVRKCMGFK